MGVARLAAVFRGAAFLAVDRFAGAFLAGALLAGAFLVVAFAVVRFAAFLAVVRFAGAGSFGAGCLAAERRDVSCALGAVLDQRGRAGGGLSSSTTTDSTTTGAWLVRLAEDDGRPVPPNAARPRLPKNPPARSAT